eukprot:scaffold310_cov307-Pinguiococcus_pyrenoidosus.AAC.1
MRSDVPRREIDADRPRGQRPLGRSCWGSRASKGQVPDAASPPRAMDHQSCGMCGRHGDATLEAAKGGGVALMAE